MVRLDGDFFSRLLNGGELVYTVADGTSGWVTIDVTDYVRNDLSNGYSYSCFSMNYDTTGTYNDRNASFSFYSANSATNTPFMIVPEPSTCAAIAGCCVLGLAFLAKRRKMQA